MIRNKQQPHIDTQILGEYLSQEIKMARAMYAFIVDKSFGARRRLKIEVADYTTDQHPGGN